MKQKLLLMPLLASLLLMGATSCSSNEDQGKMKLTYGNMATNTATKINYGDLLAKMDDKETFMIATYESDNTGCTCWTQLKYSMDSLVKEKHYQFYQIPWAAFGEKDTMGLTVIRDRPCFHFVNKGKVSDTYVYSLNNQNPIFKSKSALDELIQEKCEMPDLYLTNAKATFDVKSSILDKLKTKEEFVVCYYSESCGDCKYLFPHLLYSYVDSHDFKIPMYMVDLDVEGVAFKDGVKNKQDPQYQAYKDLVGLSTANNKKYGYNQGVVPTFHYYKNGELKDASIYFNDKIVKDGASYKVSDSFYSKERQADLHYLDNVSTPVLKDKIIDANEIATYGDIAIWKQDFAAKFHTPLLTAFFDTYLI